MIERMAKIEIVGLIEELDDTMDLLQRLGTVQIEEIPTVEDSGQSHLHRIHLDKKREQLLEGYEELIATVREILDDLREGEVEEFPLDKSARDELSTLDTEEMTGRVTRISREVRRLARHRRNLLQDMESTRQYESLINTFLPLLEQAGSVGKLEQVGVILKHSESSILEILKNRIDEITGPETTVLHQKMPDNTIGVFIMTHHEDLSAVRELLGNEGVAEYHIPREFRRETLRESIETIRERVEEIPRELEKIDSQLLEAKRSHAALLRFIHSLCTDRVNQLRILSRLVRTRYTFVIFGWTPFSALEHLKQQLSERFGERVYIGSVKINELDFLHIPTLLKNSGLVHSFETLMKLLPPPKYENLDATPFITLFFPLFFGIILGDMAYGLLLLVIAGIIKRKAAKGGFLSDVGSVALTAGVLTVFFGFLFGEFLGDYGEHYLGMHPVVPWLHRANAIEVMLLLSLALGAFHVMLGFALKAYVGIISRHIKGVIEGVSKITLILGIIGVFAQLFLGFPLLMRYAAYAMMGVGILGIMFSEGFIGLLEIISMFGNILSYSRIMAIGLASVILAIVANKLAEASPNIITAIMIGSIIHLINFAMGVFSPTIHSLRLHYVEFFSKFFRAEGKPFQPFKKIGGEHS